jgi:multiple sugar transport system permease protein
LPSVTPVEARSLKGRLFHVAVILVLIIGSATMIYPFLIMVAGSMRSQMDAAELSPVVSYLFDDEQLTRKFFETKYNQRVTDLNRSHHWMDASFEEATVPGRVSSRYVGDFERFFEEKEIPLHWQNLGGVWGYQTTPENLRNLRQRLKRKFDGDLAALGQAIGSPLETWLQIEFRPPEWYTQRYNREASPLLNTYLEMLGEAPLGERVMVSVTGYFLETIAVPRYGRASVQAYNDAHAIDIESYRDFVLPRTVPGEDQPLLREEWIEYVKEQLNSSFVVLRNVPVAEYRNYLREKYATIEQLNEVWGLEYRGFSTIEFPAGEWLNGSVREDYRDFLVQQAPETWRLVGAEYRWRDWLRERYDQVGALNEAYGTDYAEFAEVRIPMAQLEKQHVQANSGGLRWDYAVRNYVNVFDQLFLEGRVLFNTVVLVVLIVGFNLLLNPLAAYALSRYDLPGTYKILLILMATIAFPPMVAMIPRFLALREVGLLNTFVALVLPAVINGYLIFLLKGFFDSLPQSLYDAARIDGASELRMFFQITMALSKPILAVVALRSFNAAWRMFLYALIVCPARHMWVISVWLYQFQQEASMPAVFASVLISSVPSLLMFLVAQRTIMRGIVIPTEK